MAIHYAGILPWRGVNNAAALTACLLLGCSTFAVAASNSDGPFILASTSEPRVAQFVVRFRPGFEGADRGTIRSALQDELQRSLGQSLSASPSTSVRTHVLRLNQPVSLREARRLVGTLRMRPDVVYAELDPGERPQKRASKAAATQGSATPKIRRLMVIFAEPALAAKSRNNETLGVEWDDKLSASAGVPLHVARATIAGAWVVEFLAAVDVATAEIIATRLQADGIARLAAPDYVLAPMVIPNDPALGSGKQWNLSGPSARPYYGIDAERAWDITTGSPGIVIAVVDSGIVPHPDLSTRILPGYNFISDPVDAGNGVGRSNDATDLGDWRTPGLCPAPFDAAADSSWHGTLVTGIVAANSNNGIGIAGIDWNAQVLPVRVLGKCGGSVLDLVEGIEWAAGIPLDFVPVNPTPAHVINLSLGLDIACDPLFQEFFDLLLDGGIFIVASAGNENVDADGTFPANCLGLSAVGATDPYGMRASYSNFGQSVDISAPGGDGTRHGIAGAILSTWNYGTTVADAPTYAYVSGTSSATPHVAGVASLMMAVNPNLMPAQIKQLMAQTASPFAAGSDCLTGICGAGIVNAYAAVLASANFQLPAMKLDLNQHGLTGSWYEPATSGQGFEVEVFANPSSGTGGTFVSWFTYDTVTGGAERQRWYTAQGQVVTGQPNAALTIYRNTGGNFNAPPATTAQVVGTATLSFDTCSSGQLAYAFTDGTGRSGTIPLTRLLQNATCSISTPYPTNADFALSGNWYDPATSGQGFTVEVNPSGVFFLAWYTYAPNGAGAGVAGQRWYTAQGAFTPGLRSIRATIYETTGGVFDTATPPGQTTVPVGTGTMAFQSCSAATFSYNFTGGSSGGRSGTISLSRVGPVPPGCTT